MEEVLTSTTARQLGRTAVREILRGMFKTGSPMSASPSLTTSRRSSS